MEFNQAMPDGGMLFGVGLEEYIKAIQEAPEGTLIKVGELEPEQWMKCLGCGAEMSKQLTEYHECP